MCVLTEQSMSYILPNQRIKEVQEVIVDVAFVEGDRALATIVINWLNSKETGLTLNMKLGYTPTWRSKTAESSTSPGAMLMTAFIGIWYQRFDTERAEISEKLRSSQGGFSIGILPLHEERTLQIAETDSDVDGNISRRALADL